MTYTREELERLPDRSDWDRARAMTQDEIEAAIASDPDEAGMVVDWSTATTELPVPKEALSIRLDADVVAFFRGGGSGYQTRINAVLRAYVEAATRKAG